MLAKTCPRRSTTSWNKERWIKLKEQAKQHSMHLFLIFFPKTSKTSRNQDFLFFSTIFLYFSPNRCNTSSNHKNLHLKQRWDVAYRKSGAFLKNWKITWKPQNSFLVTWHERLQTARCFYRMHKISSSLCCKKLSQNGAPSEKLCLFYRR